MGLWDLFDLLDDILIVVGVAIAVLTEYFDIGIVTALAGLGLMWAKGEIG